MACSSTTMSYGTTTYLRLIEGLSQVSYFGQDTTQAVVGFEAFYKTMYCLDPMSTTTEAVATTGSSVSATVVSTGTKTR